MNHTNVSAVSGISYIVPGPAYLTVWHIVYAVIAVPTVTGNLLIILSIARFRKLRCNMHVLIGNLALSDLLVGTVLIPYDVIGDFLELNSRKYFCLVKLTIFIVTLGGSCFNLLLISIERYAVIVYPVILMNMFTKRKLIVMIVFGWLYVFVNAALPVWGWNTYKDDQKNCVSDEVWSEVYKQFTYSQFVIVLITNFILYGIVMRVAVRNTNQRRLNGDMIVHNNSVRDLQKLTTMVIVMGMFALCWSPYTISVAILCFYDPPVLRFIRRCSIIPGLINSAVNWLIYGWRNRDFRRAFKVLARCKSDQLLNMQPPSVYIMRERDSNQTKYQGRTNKC